MAKLRGWKCNTCGVVVAKVNKGLKKAMEVHSKDCSGDKRGICTYSITNLVNSHINKKGDR